MLKKIEKLSLPELEKRVLEFWKRDDTFRKSLENTKAKKPFVFFEGPPGANGLPGIHHMLSRAFKDIVLRYKTMRGYHVPRRAGWDTQGLPVELGVEKALGITHKSEIEKFGIAEFNDQARQSVWRYKEEWERLTERLGFWLDMKDPYITYDNSYLESLWWVFRKIHDRKLLKKFYKVVPYCPRCQTSLSSHELAQPGAYKKTSDPSLYVKFELVEPKRKQKSHLLVWTTTPWTLSANVMVAVNPKLTYTKYKVGDEFLWSANPPMEIGGARAEVVEKISGKKLIGLKYKPLYKLPAHYRSAVPRYFSVVGADFVSAEDGTGLVHIAPAFGEEDLQTVRRECPKVTAEDIPLTIDDQGKVLPGFPGAGKFIKKADEEVVNDLRVRGLVYDSATTEHEYPFCWRCATPLIYFARDSWFVEMSRLRTQLIKENAKVNWIPDHIREGRFGEWLREVKDWAISRERYWGTPLPIWECEKCDATTVAGSLADLVKHDYRKNTFMLLRHTEATHILEHLIGSGPEKGKHIAKLTEKGVVDAEKIAKALKKKKIDAIFASPYMRTQEMAKIISKATGVPVITDERLVEVNTGVFNWRPVGEYHLFFKKPIEKFTQTPPGGENLTDVKRRMLSFALEVNERYRGKNILVVGHGYPLWMLEAVLGGFTNEQILAIPDQHVGELREVKMKNMPRNKDGLLDMHRPYIDAVHLACAKCKGRMTRVPEVADVWFDSGAMPWAQWHHPFEKKLEFPADYIVEGVDQTRGWFYTLLAVSLLLRKGAPYRNVMVLGLITDKNGQKMSKSKGNVVDPGAMFDMYGADVLRWYFYTVNAPSDFKKFDEADLKKISNKVFSILYNSYVFFDTYAEAHMKFEPKLEGLKNVLDRWVIARLHQTIDTVTKHVDSYDIGEGARDIEGFIDDLSHWYIRRSRRRLQKSDDRKDYEDALATFRYVFEELAKLLAPFAPFFAEALHQSFHKNESVHLTAWPEANRKFIDKGLIAAMGEARALASAGLALRAAKAIKVRQPLAELRVRTTPTRESLAKNQEILDVLRDEVNVKRIVFSKTQGDDLELDTSITEELRVEGVLRDMVRSIQGLRQSADLKPKDMIEVYIDTRDEALAHILSVHSEFFLKEVGAKAVHMKKSEKFLAEELTKMDNKEVWFGIAKL